VPAPLREVDRDTPVMVGAAWGCGFGCWAHSCGAGCGVGGTAGAHGGGFEPDLAGPRPPQMYCTGGIRCDVYSTFLRQKGFNQLYTLEGGVQ
jgi:hypothetical protein